MTSAQARPTVPGGATVIAFAIPSDPAGRPGALAAGAGEGRNRRGRSVTHALPPEPRPAPGHEGSGGGQPPPVALEAALIEGILARDGPYCAHCGEAGSESTLRLEMATPPSYGGSCRWQNLLASCDACRTAKAGRTALRFDLDRFRLLLGAVGAMSAGR